MDPSNVEPAIIKWFVATSIAILALVVPFFVLVVKALWSINGKLESLNMRALMTSDNCVRSEKDRKEIWVRLDEHGREIGRIDGRVTNLESKRTAK